jgi:hypothetical protein
LKKLTAARAVEALDEVKEDITAKVEEGYNVGICVDGWESVSKEHLDGIILYVGGHAYSLETIKSGPEHDGLAVARDWEHLLKKHGELYPISYHCSDDAGQCARARRILRLRWPHVLFTKCFAHQVNLMVGALLKTDPFVDNGDKAIKAAKALNKSSSKWLPILRNIVVELYGRGIDIRIQTVGDTRWNSVQGCFASQLRIRSACKQLALRHKEHQKFPAELIPWESDSFWFDTEEAELLIRPLCDSSYLLQRTSNTIAHVVLVFLNLAVHIIQYCGEAPHKGLLLMDIEKRWAAEENVLFFLGFLLHPEYRPVARRILDTSHDVNGSWATGRNALSEGRLRQAVVFYYRKFCLFDTNNHGEEQEWLVRQFTLWISGRIKIDNITFMSYQGEYPAEWWLTHKSELPQLARFAVFLLSAPVQGADCERLFKDLAGFHTKVRNRMHATTTFDSACITHSLRRNHAGDYEKNSGSKTRNRFVKPDEYPKVDALSLAETPLQSTPNEYPLRQPSQSQREFPLGQTQQHHSQEQLSQCEETQDQDVVEVEDDSSATSNSSDEEEHIDEDDDGDLDLSKSSHMNLWLKILSENVEDNDESDNDDIYEAPDEFNNLLSQFDEEDDCEVAPTALAPLPLVNDPKYPQEDQTYFKNKNYLRKDRYSLARMVEFLRINDDYALPSILSGYGNKGSSW